MVECPEDGKLGEVFRHELVTYFAVMKKSDFKKIKLKFFCEKHPISKKPVNLDFDLQKFT